MLPLVPINQLSLVIPTPPHTHGVFPLFLPFVCVGGDCGKFTDDFPS